MTGKILKINWLRLLLALVLSFVAVTLFIPKPVEGA
jgi:hypothetical protein